MASPSLAQETVAAALDELGDQPDTIVQATHPNGPRRWIVAVDGGFRWLTPAEGRDRVQPRDATASTLRHYDAVEVTPIAEAPDGVRRAAGGWFGMVGGTDDTTFDERS